MLNKRLYLLPAISLFIVINCLNTYKLHANDYYRWTDENGTTHFSEHPPQSLTAEKITLEGNNHSKDDSNASHSENTGQSNPEATAENKPSPSPNTQEPTQKSAHFDQGKCTAARASIASLNSGIRSRHTDPVTGELVIMSDAERKRRKEQSKRAERYHCR